MKTRMTAILVLLPILATAARGTETNRIEATQLQRLDLSGLTNFWQGSAPEPTQRDPSGVLFKDSAGFADARSWWTKERSIGISLFASQEAAIAAMESRTTNVASVVTRGTNTVLAAKWWYTSGIPNGIFVCHRNAIVEVECYGGKYEDRAELLKSTVRRVIQNIKDSTTAKKDK